MSALTEDIGGMLTTLVEAQRGMTSKEVEAFLADGTVPDLSKPPVDDDDEEDDENSEGSADLTTAALTDGEVQEALGKPVVIASSEGTISSSLVASTVSANTEPTVEIDVDAITAALGADTHDGAMIALVPSAADLERLAIPEGEAPDVLHLTLRYLGQATMIPVEVQRDIIKLVSSLVLTSPTIVGNGFAVSMFNPEGKSPCVVLGLGGSQLEKMYETICHEIDPYLTHRGVAVPPAHQPWAPHVTLMYTDDADLSYFTDKTGPVTFDKVRVAFGENVYDIPLGDTARHEYRTDMIAAGTASFAKERDVNERGGAGHQLRDYWVRGPGAAKIGWGTDGSFDRCVRLLGEHVNRPQGLCAEYHKAATGEWPAEEGVPSSGDTIALSATADKDVSDVVDDDEYIPVDDNETRYANWQGVLTVEGIESGDGRMFAPNSLTWDQPPLPLMWQKETSHGGPHNVSVRVGTIRKIWREPDPLGRADTYAIKGEGDIDLGSEDGREVYRRMYGGDMRGNSVDVDSVKPTDVELVYDPSEVVDIEVPSGDDTTKKDDIVTVQVPTGQPLMSVYHSGRIRATTLVEIPAFTEARLGLTSTPIVAAAGAEHANCGCNVAEVADADCTCTSTMTAATTIFEITDAPPREWFSEPTDVETRGALTVTSEGRIFGYLAPAGVRHRSYANQAQYVPLHKVDYGRFMGGETIVSDGSRVPTGVITMNCGHASTTRALGAQGAKDHYDNTCAMVATVCVGENRHGVWVAGALLPDVTDAQVRRMMACRLSGDWRAHGDKPGWRELVAALLVPVPGFPMARTGPSVSLRNGELVASTVPVNMPTSMSISMLNNAKQRAQAIALRARVHGYRTT